MKFLLEFLFFTLYEFSAPKLAPNMSSYVSLNNASLTGVSSNANNLGPALRSLLILERQRFLYKC